DFTADGVPYPWLVSYVLEPLIGVAALVVCDLWRPAEPGTHRLSGCFAVAAVVFRVAGLLLLFAPPAPAAPPPWEVTATLARVYAAILLAFALGSALAALERRTSALRPFALGGLTLFASAAIVSLVHRDRFPGGTSAWLWAAALTLSIALFAAASIAALR